VLFDCHDYRMMRVEELQLAAEAAADRVRRTGIAYRFNPMTSRERRIIHMALRGEAGVRTESEGAGPQRRVVIHPAQASTPHASKPHAPSR
jgi:spoIIIJ-associated protein